MVPTDDAAAAAAAAAAEPTIDADAAAADFGIAPDKLQEGLAIVEQTQARPDGIQVHYQTDLMFEVRLN
jgi:hypothetical protein